MIKYPNLNKPLIHQNKNLSGKSIYANRGMTLEGDIGIANNYYLINDKAIIYKKPTPIQVLHINNKDGKSKIDDAYFLSPSTTDYNGIYKGKYIDFEAKETQNKKSFPLANIHQNQYIHLKRIVEHGGIGFFIISFVKLDEIYLVDASVVIEYFSTNKSSIPYEEIKNRGHLITHSYPLVCDYLKVVDQVYFK